MSSKRLIFNFTESELIVFLEENGFPKYMYKQLIKWIYTKYELNPYKFSDISKVNREKLKEIFSFQLPKIVKISIDPEDETKKYLLKVGKHEIETVLIKEEYHYTPRISTDVACQLKS